MDTGVEESSYLYTLDKYYVVTVIRLHLLLLIDSSKANKY